VLKYALNNCAPNGLIIGDSLVETTDSKTLSFAEASAGTCWLGSDGLVRSSTDVAFIANG
jgi:hypothetical protein